MDRCRLKIGDGSFFKISEKHAFFRVFPLYFYKKTAVGVYFSVRKYYNEYILYTRMSL